MTKTQREKAIRHLLELWSRMGLINPDQIEEHVDRLMVEH